MQRAQIRRKWYRTELRVTHFLDRLGLPDNQKLFLVTLLIGGICGLVAVLFHVLIKAAERNIIRHVFIATGWRQVVLTLLVPTLGGLVVGVLLQFWVPDARGSGIPQVKTAFFFNHGRIPMKSAFGKMTVAIISLGTGASIGREGPTVQICAAVSSFLGRFFSVSRRRLMEIIPVGSAAAVAAAFNTPIAAVTFAFEEIIGDLNQRMLGGIVIAAVIASVISRGLEGRGPIFAQVPAYGLNHWAELIFYVLLGAIAAGAAVFFSRTLLRLRLIFRRLRSVPPWLKPAIGGLAVGIIGLFAPQAMGGGYDTISLALKGDLNALPLALLMTLSVAKIVTTVLSYSSGGSGGIFAPSLFIGAMVGGTVGQVVKAAFPGSPTAPGAFALVGMGAMFCGVIRAPITSVLIIFEMTSNYTLILPLMIANAISYLIASRLEPTPIYEALLMQDGIHLPHSKPTAPLNRITAGSVMTREVVTLHADLNVRAALEEALKTGHYGYPVVESVNGKQRMSGFITCNELKQYVEEGAGEAALGEVAIKEVIHAHPDHTLDRVMLKLGQGELSLLPVVSRTDPGRLVGIISMRDLVRAQARLTAQESRHNGVL
ncbi:MAG TPA: chloride channel protein [Blastocatellia bacterium]|nr:chloride channel protein [Blastocatellia bacterium]